MNAYQISHPFFVVVVVDKVNCVDLVKQHFDKEGLSQESVSLAARC